MKVQYFEPVEEDQIFEPEEEDWNDSRDLDLSGIDAMDAWAQCTETEIVSRETLWRII